MRPGRELSRGSIALIAAFAAHGAALVALRLLPARTASNAAPVGPVTPIDVDLLREPHAEPAPSRAESSGAAVAPPAGPAARASSLGSASSAQSDDAAHAATPALEPQDVAPVGASDGDGWSLRVTRVDIGVDPRGRASAIARAGALAADRSGSAPSAPGTASTSGGLTEGLDEGDVARGLGRGGLVRSAVEGAVQASNVMGNATFAIRIDSAGSVSVSLDDASADRASWSALSDAIRADVTTRRAALRLPPDGHGLLVVVRAEAKDQLPDGRDPKRLGERVEATAGTITETRDKIDIKLPSATFVHEGKVCAAGLHVGLDGVGILGGCSPENTGSTAVRIVAARVLREARL